MTVITSMSAFVHYFEGIRERTLRFIESIPAGEIDFTPHAGKFTLGDLIRHIGSTERMFVEVVLDGRWLYPGHGPLLGASKAEAVAYLETVHAEVRHRLAEAPADALTRKRPTPDGHEVSAWRLLMLMAEHEVHHRAQISQYLVDLGLQPPQIFGRRVEEMPHA